MDFTKSISHKNGGIMMVEVKIDDGTAKYLSLFCKRALIDRVRPFSADESEAVKMLEALDNLKLLLEGEGVVAR